MPTRTKRTYNLPVQTVHRVRELAARPELESSQDRIVELAIDELYRSVRDREEAASWGRAAVDPEFQAEMRQVDADLRPHERWPE